MTDPWLPMARRVLSGEKFSVSERQSVYIGLRKSHHPEAKRAVAVILKSKDFRPVPEFEFKPETR